MSRNFLRLLANTWLVSLVLGACGDAAFANPAPSGGGDDDRTGETAPEVSEAQREEARARFGRGTELYDEGEFKLALIEFERAYSIVPGYRILYNIGQVQQQLGRYAKALVTLERYLAVGGKRIAPERRAAVEKDIATLRMRTAKLTVMVSEPGADISIDGASLGVSPLAPDQLIDAGEHRLVISKKKFQTESRTLVLAGGDAIVSRFTLTRENNPATATPPAPSTTPMWVAWTATGLLAAGAGVTGFLTLRENAELDSMRKRVGTTERDRQDQQSTVDAFAALTDGLIAGAIVAGGVALYLTLKHPSSTQTPRVGASGMAWSF